MDISKLKDDQLIRLIDDRFKSSETVWSTVSSVYDRNSRYYDAHVNGDFTPDYIRNLPIKDYRIRANRIFVNTEAVINSVIANPPKPNVIAGREGEDAQDVAAHLQEFYGIKYEERGIKEIKRKALRNLYLSRLYCIKYFWNSEINDVDARSLDPRKVRIAKNANSVDDSPWLIEEVEDSLSSLIAKFPDKKIDIAEKMGFNRDEDDLDDEILIRNPEVSYREFHTGSHVAFTFKGLVLGKIRNPYWDWDGVPMTEEQREKLENPNTEAKERRQILEDMNQKRPDKETKKEAEENAQNAYSYNHFDVPKKPYIMGTILTNEDGPIGRTSFIEQGITLQESIDRSKRQIARNADTLNGVIKVDTNETQISKQDAQALNFEAGGVIYGPGVSRGVTREVGSALSQSVYQDMVDSRNELDNLMAASSAFRGEREGTETKAGRLALIEQSALRLNELVQAIDYMDYQLFNGWFQLGKVFYTEHHYAKTIGNDGAARVIELNRDMFEDGMEMRVIAGKTLPEDQTFKFERAQNDVAAGFISPIDYLREAGYANPQEVAKNAELYKVNPIKAAGITDDELQELAPPQQEDKEEPKPPSVSVKYEDLPNEARIQVLAQMGIEVSPEALDAKSEARAAVRQQELDHNEREQERNELMTLNDVLGQQQEMPQAPVSQDMGQPQIETQPMEGMPETLM